MFECSLFNYLQTVYNSLIDLTITINNKTEISTTQEKLFGLLSRLNLSGKQGIAVAVNNTVVSKTNWDSYELKENDKITIIRATQGG